MSKPIKSDLEVLSGAVALDDLKNVVGGGRFDPVDGGIWDEPASGLHLEPAEGPNPGHTSLTYGDGGIWNEPAGAANQGDPTWPSQIPAPPEHPGLNWRTVGWAMEFPYLIVGKNIPHEAEEAGHAISHEADKAGHAIKHFFHHW